MVGNEQGHLVVGGHANNPVGNELGFVITGAGEGAALGLIYGGAILGQLDAEDLVVAAGGLGVDAAVNLHQSCGAAGVFDGKCVGGAKRHAIGGGGVKGAGKASGDVDALRTYVDGASIHFADLAAYCCRCRSRWACRAWRGNNDCVGSFVDGYGCHGAVYPSETYMMPSR